MENGRVLNAYARNRHEQGPHRFSRWFVAFVASTKYRKQWKCVGNRTTMNSFGECWELWRFSYKNAYLMSTRCRSYYICPNIYIAANRHCHTHRLSKHISTSTMALIDCVVMSSLFGESRHARTSWTASKSKTVRRTGVFRLYSCIQICSGLLTHSIPHFSLNTLVLWNIYASRLVCFASCISAWVKA